MPHEDGASAEVDDRLSPDMPTTTLKGVGPRIADLLVAAGISSIRDLLLFFPRRHQELKELSEPDQAHVGQQVRLRGVATKSSRSWLPGRRSLVTVTFACGGEPVRARFFNQPWLADSFPPGTERQLEGKLGEDRSGFVLDAPRIVSPKMDARGECVVHYRSIEGVSPQRIRAFIDQALRLCRDHSLEFAPLPSGLHDSLEKPSDALRAMHQPVDADQHEAARRWFALGEAVELFRGVEQRRRRREAHAAPEVRLDDAAEAEVAACFAFDWTGDQSEANAVLAGRLRGPSPTGLLLHGDVGTGKTAVALAAAARVVRAGWQVAFLAPTEVLAEQLIAVAAPILAPLGAEPVLLVGSLSAARRREVAAGIAGGRHRVVFGTHALMSESTEFDALGLVVIDEQHRFGVGQRAALARKGHHPHVIVMTATPIPRTLTFTLFGDLDVVALKDRPRGYGVSRAVFVARESWERVLKAVDRHVRRDGGVFVVCPKIGEDGSKGGAVLMHRALGERFRCGLVHGRIPADERQATLHRFREGELDVLVGTTVLEVGIDVPRATLIVVVGVDRFGVATLHQLRGRVGRGERRGLCILSGERNERADAVCSTTDGFELAEQDLRIRGAGELLGARQSGALDFRALDPLDDAEILNQARSAVRREAMEEQG